VTVLGDDLYCHEPFCRELLAQGFEFILVCKPDSHPLLYEWVEFLERSGSVKTLVRKRWTGKRHGIDTKPPTWPLNPCSIAPARAKAD
jgi:hypothetical protein